MEKIYILFQPRGKNSEVIRSKDILGMHEHCNFMTLTERTKKARMQTTAFRKADFNEMRELKGKNFSKGLY